MERAELAELELARLTLIKVVWEDITDDTVGDPEEAHLSERTTYALFWKFIEDENVGTPSMVLTYCDDKELSEQAGWLCVPLSCITEVEVIRRPKKGRKRKDVTIQAGSEHQGSPATDVDSAPGSGGDIR